MPSEAGLALEWEPQPKGHGMQASTDAGYRGSTDSTGCQQENARDIVFPAASINTCQEKSIEESDILAGHGYNFKESTTEIITE